ncbi:phosphoribosylformylglycinamidine synthase [Parascardovia denticolens IPLA 20019]|uniref:phosphoribosylformylglycinamidine synthase n=1 Tax=Parascardovia denticolens TaxID=78258 RepID=UPI000266D2D9|nr:phosphoribosylformylglycinamidine synthase [Parascardovia denticolens]EIT88394.1 phosphoribosylformylglycinamidine synthase [Parascardovia denticolens IPLA 20019]
MVERIYVEKKPQFDTPTAQLFAELRAIVGISSLTGLRLLKRYDVEGISPELMRTCVPTVFSEPQTDLTYAHLSDAGIDGSDSLHVFAVESLPGQFNQRAASASECVQLISQGERPTVRTAEVYLLEGQDLTETDAQAIRSYVINPVDSRLARLDKPETLTLAVPQPQPVAVLDGFRQMGEQDLQSFIDFYGLAMDQADLLFCQDYFRQEDRDPSITEIRVIDTYWSDHCRHTTFGTELDRVEIDDKAVAAAFRKYLLMRQELGRQDHPVTLMDMGTIGAKYLKSQGILKNLDESEEINACTVKVTVDVDGHDQDWLFLFKNETHNHPTEIEPFGGAATCIGGCIRDPLSGRSYVYQAMRVTGAGDPRQPISQTLKGKLPQRKLVTTAAAGYSSYGNQIGLATGQVNELYHPGYVAKRMEVGAVVGAAPQTNVKREKPVPGDLIILLGGRTGRDGIGGATGASKSHNVESIEKDGAEVQKGNAPEERKLQRLFRRQDAASLIKRCNDFGAGGVSVAVGELADSLDVNLDEVPKKYEGLDGTELAISESQERMAVVLDPQDLDRFLSIAREENLEASLVATVTDSGRMRMSWRGETIVDLSRRFLASNGAPKHQAVHVETQKAYTIPESWSQGSLQDRMQALLSNINVASNKGLSERFDSTIGAATVLMPFGGKNQLTPTMAMVAKFPTDGQTNTASAMAWGFNPYLMEANQFTGAYLSVVESISKLVAAGFLREKAYLSFQEYFEKLRQDPSRWGKPTAALLGALMAQIDLGVGAIGGKDSMSGSFEDLDVPPTLVSFAVSVGKARQALSPEFKQAGHRLLLLTPAYQADGLTPEPTSLVKVMNCVQNLAQAGPVSAATTPGFGGLAQALFLQTVGNGIGADLDAASSLRLDDLFQPRYGSFLLELSDQAAADEGLLTQAVESADFHAEIIGHTREDFRLKFGDDDLDLASLREIWESGMESVFPYRDKAAGNEDRTRQDLPRISYQAPAAAGQAPLPHPSFRLAKPRVIIPVFPGNNCEYDSTKAFHRAGAEADVFVINNLDAQSIAASSRELADRIRKSQIVMIPGGFSGGDEPDGSAKFIASFFRSPQVTDAVRDLLQNRDGLMLGICNGFQALIKLGLVPFGDIVPMDESCPTLTFNTIGRHQSRLVRTRVASTKSPWLSRMEVGDIHTIAISHGEGRFVANEQTVRRLIEGGQIATQYVDREGNPSYSLDVNPNGSLLAVEGITSPDGRVLGKMGHTERGGRDVFQNVPGDAFQPLFEGGVGYFLD